MKVRAIKQGEHHGFREIGDVFDIAEDQPMAHWWVAVDAPVVKPVKEPEMQGFSQLNRKTAKQKFGGAEV